MPERYKGYRTDFTLTHERQELMAGIIKEMQPELRQTINEGLIEFFSKMQFDYSLEENGIIVEIVSVLFTDIVAIEIKKFNESLGQIPMSEENDYARDTADSYGESEGTPVYIPCSAIKDQHLLSAAE